MISWLRKLFRRAPLIRSHDGAFVAESGRRYRIEVEHIGETMRLILYGPVPGTDVDRLEMFVAPTPRGVRRGIRTLLAAADRMEEQTLRVTNVLGIGVVTNAHQSAAAETGKDSTQ